MSTKYQMNLSFHGVFQPMGSPMGDVNRYSGRRDTPGKSRPEVADTIRTHDVACPIDYRAIDVGAVQVRAVARAVAAFRVVEDDRPGRVKLHLDTYLRRRVPAMELMGVGMLAA